MNTDTLRGTSQILLDDDGTTELSERVRAAGTRPHPEPELCEYLRWVRRELAERFLA